MVHPSDNLCNNQRKFAVHLIPKNLSFLWVYRTRKTKDGLEANTERNRVEDNKNKGQVDTAANVTSISKSKPWNRLTRVSLLNLPVVPFPLQHPSAKC